MPMFTHGADHCEAIQLDKVNSAGRPMFNSALPPWLFDAMAKHHTEDGFFLWDGGLASVRCADGFVDIDPGDWVVRSPGGKLEVYDPAAFDSSFSEVPAFDPEEL